MGTTARTRSVHECIPLNHEVNRLSNVLLGVVRPSAMCFSTTD